MLLLSIFHWVSVLPHLPLSLDLRSLCFSFVAFLRSFSNALKNTVQTWLHHCALPHTKGSFYAVPVYLEGAPGPCTNFSSAGRCCLFHPSLPFLLFGRQSKDTDQEEAKEKEPELHPEKLSA